MSGGGMNVVNIMGCCNAKTLRECPPGGENGGYKQRGRPEGGSKNYLPSPSLDGSSSQTLRGLPEERPAFTAHQKQVVLESWKVIQKDISRVGVVMFMG